MRRFLWTCAAIFCAFEPVSCFGQQRADEPPPRPVVTRQNWFSIPYHISPARSPQQQPVEVQLFVSDDGGRTWQLHERVAPEKGQVSFQAIRDGQYCFCIRTLDKSDRLHPSRNKRPEMIVVVDTESPRLELHAQRGPRGDVTAHWRIEELHLKRESLKVEYKTSAGDGQWQALAIDPLQIDSSGLVHTGTVTWWPPVESGAITVRAVLHDVAGNRTDHQTHVAAARIQPPTEYGSTNQVVGNEPSPSSRQSHTYPQAGNPGDRFAQRAATPRGQPTTRAQRAYRPTPFGGPTPDGGKAPAGAVTDRVHPPVRNQVGPLLGPNMTGSEGLPPGERPRMVNSLRFELEYEVESIGPSGIGKVQLWGTQDGGQSWRRFGIDADNRSPLPVTVEGEGLYGFRIVVESGTGLHGRLPHAGDPPEVWVGVDTSQPEVELLTAEQGTGEQAGMLVVTWRAEDTQLASRPVSLLIRDNPVGVWSPIASGLPNNSRFAWPLDNRVPDRIFLRLEVRDEAGNIRVIEHHKPIPLDRARPEGRIRGVRSLPSGTGASRNTPRNTINNPFFRR